jgi:gliding motility-associated lipoprotein GldH
MFLNRFKTKLFFYTVVVLSLSSCGGKDFLYHENVLIEKEVWSADNRLPFLFTVTDTASVYWVGLNVRYTLNFPMQNLYVFLHTAFPDGMHTCDTISIDLFSKEGTPFGQGKRIKELDVPIAKIRFPQSGQYNIYLEQGMRTRNLEGMVSMGLYIKTARNKK